MTTKQEDSIHLPPWSEAAGIFGGLYADDYCLYVKMGDKALVFAKGSKEAEIAQGILKSDLIGKKIALLHTDQQTRPTLRVRVIEK